MSNLNPAQKHKIIQVLMTVFLISVLLSIVALYLYYGMYLARQNDTAVEVPVEEVQPLTESDERARRLNVLNELAKASSSTSSYEDRMQTLQNLEKESGTSEISTEERLKMLKDLETSVATEVVE